MSAPDDRDVDDISAVEECDYCGWSPAAIILVDGDWGCYNCGHDPDETDDIVTDGGTELDEFVRCIRCNGSGEYIECYDDLCHANGRCMHGNNTCALCGGYRRTSRELRNRWESRDAFAAVELPEPDRRFRGIDTEQSGGGRDA